MESEHFYEVSVKWKVDRKGTLSSPDLETTIKTQCGRINTAIRTL